MKALLSFMLLLIYAFGSEEESEDIKTIKSSFQTFPRMISLSSRVRTQSAPPALCVLFGSLKNRANFPLPVSVVRKIQDFLDMRLQQEHQWKRFFGGFVDICGRLYARGIWKKVPIVSCRLLPNHPLFQCPAFDFLQKATGQKNLSHWRSSTPSICVYRFLFPSKRVNEIRGFVRSLRSHQRNRVSEATIKQTFEMKLNVRKFDRSFRLTLDFETLEIPRWIRIFCREKAIGNLIRKGHQIEHIEFHPTRKCCLISLWSGRIAELPWNDEIMVKCSIKLDNRAELAFEEI